MGGRTPVRADSAHTQRFPYKGSSRPGGVLYPKGSMAHDHSPITLDGGCSWPSPAPWLCPWPVPVQLAVATTIKKLHPG